MKQLVELQRKSKDLKKLKAEIICVLREENKGQAGAAKVAKTSKIKAVLLDSPANITKAYSQKGYTTYFIDKKGNIKAELTGTKYKRPDAKDILAEAKKAFK